MLQGRGVAAPIGESECLARHRESVRVQLRLCPTTQHPQSESADCNNTKACQKRPKGILVCFPEFAATTRAGNAILRLCLWSIVRKRRYAQVIAEALALSQSMPPLTYFSLGSDPSVSHSSRLSMPSRSSSVEPFTSALWYIHSPRLNHNARVKCICVVPQVQCHRGW